MVFIREATFEEDTKCATDMFCAVSEQFHLGFRFRRNSYMANFGNQFTIRGRLASGKNTEIHKIQEGHGDYLFYAFATPDECNIAKWLVCDLDVLRQTLREKPSLLEPSWMSPVPGGNWLYGWPVCQFPSNLIAAKSPVECIKLNGPRVRPPEPPPPASLFDGVA